MKLRKELWFGFSIMGLVVAFIVVAVIMIFVIPSFKQIFSSFGADLPTPTLLVIAMSEFFVEYWWLIFGGIGAGIYFFIESWRRSPKMQMAIDRAALKLPVFGELYNKIIIARFASTFASLSRSGVPILSALTIVSKATGSLQAEEVFKAARVNVQKGRGLSVPMEQSGLFPPLVVNMVAIGEETGSLDHMLDKISEFYSGEVDDMMGRLQSLLDPILIVFLGVVVGFIAVAMLLPMFDVITKVGNA